MDDIDRRLTSLIQEPLSLCLRPFDRFADSLGLSTEETLERLKRLQAAGTVQSLKPSLDAERLGYTSSLVAMRFPEEGVEDGAAWVNSHPGVLRSYRRTHAFNFWFTLTIPSMEFLEEHIRKLHLLCGSLETLMLPAIKIYRQGGKVWEREEKITRNLRFRWNHGHGTAPKGHALTPGEFKVMQAISEGFPAEAEPFRFLAEKLGMAEGECLEIVRLFHRRGYVRKIASAVSLAPHGASPIRHWLAIHVPEEKEDEVAAFLLSFPGVLCGYKRPLYAMFPYSLYFGLDGMRFPEAVLPEALVAGIGEWPWVLLTNSKEYKRKNFSFFAGELDTWRKACPAVYEKEFDQDGERGLLLYRNP